MRGFIDYETSFVLMAITYVKILINFSNIKMYRGVYIVCLYICCKFMLVGFSKHCDFFIAMVCSMCATSLTKTLNMKILTNVNFRREMEHLHYIHK